MKKQLIAVALIFVLLLTMAGCSVADAAQKMDAAEEIVEEKLDLVEEKLEEALRETAGAGTAAAPTAPAPTQAPPVEPEPKAAGTTEPQGVPEAAKNPQRLTEEQARKIALEYLGLSGEQVTGLRTEFEIDDGIPQYDVEFYQGDWEYEFEIHAEDGRILSYDKDHKYD